MKNNPYVGPRPYERQDRHNFYGRDRETRELRALIVAEREVLFYAQSGAGKTSLLNAQVVPVLKDKGFTVLPITRVGNELPPRMDSKTVNNVFVSSALLSLAGKDADPQALVNHTLCSYLQAIQDEQDDKKRPIVLIFDQFEEIFTTHRDRWADAEGFFHQMREALDCLPRLGVVLAMREDHIAAIDPYLPLFPRRLRARFRMERLGPQGALTAIERPAENAGCSFAPGIAERLVDDLRRTKIQHVTSQQTSIVGAYIEPVQLQVVCNQLWANLPDDKTDPIQWAEVEQYGDVDRALTDFYQSALTRAMQQTQVSESQLRRWFSQQLITPIGTRGLALRGPQQTAGLANPAVDVLQELHIIRADVRSGARWYELAHDRLVDPITQSNQAWEMAQETPLRTAARRWSDTGDESLLYREAALEKALVWSQANPDEATAYEQTFLQASDKADRARTARLRRLRRAIMAVLALGLLIMAALTAFAMKQERIAAERKTTAEIASTYAIAQQAIAIAEAGTAQAAKGTAEIASTAAIEQQNLAQTLRQEAEAEAAELEELAFVHYLASQAQNIYTSKLGSWNTSALLALESMQRYPGSAAASNLQLVFDRLGPTVTVLDHPKPIVALAFSPDAQHLATVDDDGLVYIWNTNTWQQARSFQASRSAESLVFDPDGKRLATIGDGIQVWDIENGQEINITQGDQAIALSPDFSAIAIQAERPGVQIWDASQPQERLPLQNPLYQVSFGPEGKRLMTNGPDGVIIWDVETGQELARTDWQNGQSVFSPSGKYVVISSGNISPEFGRPDDAPPTVPSDATDAAPKDEIKNIVGGIDQEKNFTIWDWQQDQELVTVSNFGTTSPNAYFSPEDHWLLTPVSGLVRLWEWEPGGVKEVARLDCSAAAISPAGSQWLAGVQKNQVWIWEWNQHFLEIAKHNLTGVDYGSVYHDRWFVQTDGNTSSITDLASDQVVARLTHDYPATFEVISANGQWAVTQYNNTVHVWDTSQPHIAAQISPNETVSGVFVDSSGEWLATQHTNSVQIWQIATGAATSRIESAYAVQTVVFSPDGQWAACGFGDEQGPGELQVWKAATGQVLVSQTSDGYMAAVDFGPNSQWLAAGSDDGHVWIFYAATGELIAELEFETVNKILFSPDASRLLVALSDKGVLLDSETWQEIAWLTHKWPARFVGFTDDSQWLLSHDETTTRGVTESQVGAKIWNAATGDLFTLVGFRYGVIGAFFVPSWLVVQQGSGAGVHVRLWEPHDIINESCARLNRNLSEQEWTLYFGDQDYAFTCPDLAAGE